MSENDRIANDMGRVEKADNVFIPNKPPDPPVAWHYEAPRGQPYVCPVCIGKGIVPHDFYLIGSNPTASNASAVSCRGCGGTGVIR